MDIEKIISEAAPKVNYKELLNKSFIDLSKPPELPPVCMQIGQLEQFDYNKRRLFTLGNFSVITGKGKSKKTFLSTLISAGFISGNCQDKFYSRLPENKKYVIRFDTEQGDYDAFKVGDAVNRLNGYNSEFYSIFDLREYSPIERCNIIEYAVKKWSENLGVLIIDGIADLAKTINDEEEANRVVQLLMTWSKVYNIHIITVVHQNKDNNYATGHIGSALIKKAECVMSVTKEEKLSCVSCENMRGAIEFDDFRFTINEDGLPVIIQNQDLGDYKVNEITL